MGGENTIRRRGRMGNERGGFQQRDTVLEDGGEE